MKILAQRLKVGDRYVHYQRGNVTIAALNWGRETVRVIGPNGLQHHMELIEHVEVVEMSPRTAREELEIVWDHYTWGDYSDDGPMATIQDLYNAVLKVMNTPPEVE